MTAPAVFSQTFMFCQQLWHQDATVSSSEISLWWLCCSGFFGQWTLFKCKSKVNVPFMVSCKWGVLLLRCCSSPKVPSERKAKWLSTGIIGYIYICARWSETDWEQDLPDELTGSLIKMTCRTNSHCTVGSCLSQGTLDDEGASTPRTWLTHALLPAPHSSLYPLHSHLPTSVSNYSLLSLAQCLSSESLWKGRGNGSHRHKATNTRSIKIQGKSEKRQVQAGFLITECCRRWGGKRMVIPHCSECHVIFSLS